MDEITTLQPDLLPIEGLSSDFATYETADTDFTQEELKNLSDEELKTLALLLSPVAEDPAPELLTITFNNTIYTHINETESFSTPDSDIPLTPLTILKQTFPETKSLYRRITPPNDLFLFGNSTRRKVIRLVQLHYQAPPITPTTSQYTPFFDYLANSPYLGGYFSMNQYYSASLYAAGRNPELATSLMLYYGWPPDFKKTLMAGTSIHRISTTPDAIILEIINTHTLQDRLNHACDQINAYLATSPLKPNSDTLIKIGMPAFYSYASSNISISSDYHTIIQAKMLTFIADLLNPINDNPPLRPAIDEPEDMLPPQTITLPYSSFIFEEKISESKQGQIQDIARKKTFDAISPLLNLDQSLTYSTAELKQYISPQRITSATKAGFLIRVKRGSYRLNLGDFPNSSKSPELTF